MSVFTDQITVTNTPLPIDGGNATAVKTDGSAVTQPVSIASSVAVTGPLTDAQLRATPVPVSSTAVTSSTATVTSVVLTGNTNTTLLAANPNRVGAVVFVPSQPAYIKFGTTASTTSFTYKVTAASTSIEFPKSYVGRIDILSQNGQTVLVTEF